MNKKSQTFTLDYILGMSLFLIGLIVSLTLVINMFPDTSGRDLNEAALTLSEELLGEGLPKDWTNETVMRIGLITNGVLDEEKYDQLHKMDYTRTIGMLNTRYDYFVFFEDKDGNLITVNGECGYGSDKVNYTKTYAFAYFFRENQVPDYDNQFLDEMINQYNAGLYYRNANPGDALPSPVGDPYSETLTGGLATLVQDLDKDFHDLAFLEDPHISDFQPFSGHSMENITSVIENWVANGNTLYLIEHVRAHEMFTTYWYDGYQDAANPVTIQETDISLPFLFNESFNFTDTPQSGPSVENLTDYKIIANYSDGNIGILKFTWYDGVVFFFSELNADYLGKNNLSDEVDYSIDKSGTRCQQIDIRNLDPKNLRKIERFVPYRSQIIKLVVYIWEENL